MASSAKSGNGTPEPSSSTSVPTEGFNISPEECIRRLRQKGQPIRLFGETDKDRRLRLRALELLQERGSTSAGAGQNDFRKMLEEMESGAAEEEIKKKAKELHRANADKDAAGGEGEAPVKEVEVSAKQRVADMPVLDLSLIKSDPNKLYPLIYYALKVGR
jgi:pre-mRNA-splicing factor 18